MKNVPEMLNAHPSVFAIEDNYQIITPFAHPAIVWIKVGENTYYDDANGILKSNNYVHKVEIPMSELDREKSYTLCYRKMINRTPYFPESEDTVELKYPFKPVEGSNINIYHISDAHNMEEPPINAGKYFGDNLDLLILNGDIPDHSGDTANFNSIYRICSGITEGSLPIVFSKGNHDTRGIYGEAFHEYTPSNNGRPYYTFRLGSLWGLVLDCGEDKDDSHDAYSYTTCFHNYRLKETKWLEDVVNQEMYNENGIEHKIVISHIPFTYIQKAPFDIEQELYRHWTKLICEKIKPELIICGHIHACNVYQPGSAYDAYNLLTCPVVIGSKPNHKEGKFTGCGITLSKKDAEIIFNSNE